MATRASSKCLDKDATREFRISKVGLVGSKECTETWRSDPLRHWNLQGSVIHLLRGHPRKSCGVYGLFDMLEMLIKKSVRRLNKGRKGKP
jgi:hypothetical protein